MRTRGWGSNLGTYKLQHESGFGFTAKGASLSDLFETAASAMCAIEYDTSTVGFEKEVSVVAAAADMQSLLAAWLNEVIALRVLHDFVPGDFMVVEVGSPPGPQYAKPGLRARGTARGRIKGAWFQRSGLVVGSVSESGVKILSKRRSFASEVALNPL